MHGPASCECHGTKPSQDTKQTDYTTRSLLKPSSPHLFVEDLMPVLGVAAIHSDHGLCVVTVTECGKSNTEPGVRNIQRPQAA